MTIKRVKLAGFTGQAARNTSTQGGRSITRLSVATTKRYRDAEGHWQGKTNWHRCLASGDTAELCSKLPHRHSRVFLEGELAYREYDRTIETDTGPVNVRWPVTEILIECPAVRDRRKKQERQGAA